MNVQTQPMTDMRAHGIVRLPVARSTPPYKTDTVRLSQMSAFALRRWHRAMIDVNCFVSAAVDKQIQMRRTERWFAVVERVARLQRIAASGLMRFVTASGATPHVSPFA